jgi:hypothetical protein
LGRIRRRREEMLAAHEDKPIEWDVVEDINRMREERDEDILHGFSAGRN